LYGSPTQLEPASAAQNETAHELQVAASPPSGAHVDVLPLLEPEPLLEPVPLLEPAPLLLVVPELLPLLDAVPLLEPLLLLAEPSSPVAGVGLLELLQAATNAAPQPMAKAATLSLRTR
jgi:hypothetical protein